MPDVTPVAPAPASPAPAPVKSGWKSTETWLMFAGFGLLGWVLERLVEILPVLATQPNIPPWVSAVIPIAMTGIAWVMKASAQKYLAARTELKLQAGAPSTPAQAADQVNKL